MGNLDRKEWVNGYNFEIHIDPDTEEEYNKIVSILGESDTTNPVDSIRFKRTGKGKEKYWFWIKQCDGSFEDFCNLVTDNKSKLESLKLKPTLWLYYIYDINSECSMDFTPDIMKIIYDTGMEFCISCIN